MQPGTTTKTDGIVLATFGTHGDLNPFIGIALALQQHQLSAVIATHEEYQLAVEGAGVAFFPMRPSRRQLQTDSGEELGRMLRTFRRRPQLILTRYVLPHLQQSYEDALTALAGARLVFTSSLSFGAKLAAQRLRIPHIAVVLQPGMMWSAYDPPVLGAHAGLNRLLYAGGPHINRVLLGFARRIAARWTQPIERFRAQMGLSPGPQPLFEGRGNDAPILGLYSSVLGRRQPDHPCGLMVVGFCFHDGAGALPPELLAFLDQADPPLIFTLGTSAVHDSSHFVAVAVEALKVLRERAVLVLDDAQCAAWRSKLPDHVRVAGFVRYSQIFPRARIIIHHGGIGTTAQALRAARPQLIAPYFVDQPDNAARVQRLQVGRVLPLDRWTPRRLIGSLRALGQDPLIGMRAARVAADMANEQGAAAAARLAVNLLRSQ